MPIDTSKKVRKIIVDGVEIPIDKPSISGTLNIVKNDTYDVTTYAQAVVNVPSINTIATLPKRGWYTTITKSTDGYRFSGSITDFNTRMYPIEEIGDNYIKCNIQNIYNEFAMPSIEIGYINENKEFVAVGTGYRDARVSSRFISDVNVTINGEAPNYGVVVLKNLSDNSLWVVCRYSPVNQTVSLITTATTLAEPGYCRLNSTTMDISVLPSRESSIVPVDTFANTFNNVQTLPIFR